MPRLTAYQAGRQNRRRPPKFFEIRNREDNRSGVEVVAFLTVLGEVKARCLVLG